MVFPHVTPGTAHRTGHGMLLLLSLLLLLSAGCAKQPTATLMEVTAYCGCSSCCGWERGSWAYLKLDFWNKYVSGGSRQGAPYSGRTASGTYPREPQQGIFSLDSLQRPWMIPLRVLLPWKFLPSDGTIAADTAYYPFGTRMYVPGYGWGRVEDRGGAIKGPARIDIFYHSHRDALQWGRRRVNVTIERQ
jgi:hypothetical protein